MEIANLDNIVAMEKALQLEFELALLFMYYVAFGYKFSGSMEQLMNLQNEIAETIALYGQMHRN